MNRETDFQATASRALLYRVISASLLPPGRAEFDYLANPDTAAELRKASADLDERRRATSDGNLESTLLAPAMRWIKAVTSVPARELVVDYERLFGHTLRGLIVPYETEYGPDSAFRQSDELADIGGFYQAFGLTLVPEPRERADHLAVESEFLSFLARKEALMRVNGDEETAGRIRDAQRLFFRDHFGCFARAVGVALMREAGHDFYSATGELLIALVRHDEIALSLSLGTGYSPLRPAIEDNVPMACGSCELMSQASDAAGNE